jgi:hypothetical protein
MMAVLGIVWAGDAATAPRPLPLDAVQLALGALHASAMVVARGSDLSDPCGNDPAGADIAFLAAPPRVWPLVATIEIEPSVAARARALGVRAGASGVALVVRTHHGPTAADRTFLGRLATALERAALSGG